jgi:hypothetical protein
MTSQVDASELLMENSTNLGSKLRPAVLVSFLFLAQLSKVEPKTLKKTETLTPENPEKSSLREFLAERTSGMVCRMPQLSWSVASLREELSTLF